MEVIPGILEKDWNQIEQKIELILPFAKSVHIDIIDGKFAPNTTFLDPKPFEKYKDKILLELHMMVDNPVQYLGPWAEAGFKRFIGQIEKMPNQAEFVAQGQLLGEVGLAIDGPTSMESIRVPISDLDTILVMTIKAGASGQIFNQDHLGKVRGIRDMSNKLGLGSFEIEVDGGINDQTIRSVRDAGANRFSATSFIYKANPLEQYEKLTSLIKLK